MQTARTSFAVSAVFAVGIKRLSVADLATFGRLTTASDNLLCKDVL
jgi:hypothetical protein